MKALLAFAFVVLAVPAMAQLPSWAESVCAQESSLECHAMHRAYNPARFYLWPNNASEARRFVDLRQQWMIDEGWQVCQQQRWSVPGDRDNYTQPLRALLHGPQSYEPNRLYLVIYRLGEDASKHFRFVVEGIGKWSIFAGYVGGTRNNTYPASFSSGDLRLNFRRVLNWLRRGDVRLALSQVTQHNAYGQRLAEFAEDNGLHRTPAMQNAGTNRLLLFKNVWTSEGGHWSTMTCDNAEF